MKQFTVGCLVVLGLGATACSRDDNAVRTATKAPAPSTAAPDVEIAEEVPAGAYTLDKAHASLIFRVDHLGFSNYTARFTKFDAQLQFDPANLEASSVTVIVDPQSIETDFPDPAKLDFNALLQSEQWLNTAQYPEMTFKSNKVESTGSSDMLITGELSLRGVARPVVLNAKFNGGYAGHPLDPQARIGFSAQGILKRSQFGMAFGVPDPGSSFGVGDDVNVIIEAEFSGPAWADAPADASAVR